MHAISLLVNGKYLDPISHYRQNFIMENLVFQERLMEPKQAQEQLSLFDNLNPSKEDKIKCLTGSL